MLALFQQFHFIAATKKFAAWTLHSSIAHCNFALSGCSLRRMGMTTAVWPCSVTPPRTNFGRIMIGPTTTPLIVHRSAADEFRDARDRVIVAVALVPAFMISLVDLNSAGGD
jgi:hypothetical protein